jgi:TonB family protein
LSSQNVAEIARQLAAHGGGAASLDLAFDLVFHEVVEEARDATGATGAAIALLRDDEMICRATTGDNAPDLGVRVETSSGLAGECVRTGVTQHSEDTEGDPRVNAEACRKLGVRSMLIVPVMDAGTVCGILQVFSPLPNKFGVREVEALQILASRVAESRKALDGVSPNASVDRNEDSPASAPRMESAVDEGVIAEDGGPVTTSREIWSAALVLLVIAAAVALGLVIGWHGGIKGQQSRPQATLPATVIASAKASENPGQSNLGASTATESVRVQPNPTANGVSVPSGGLLVTQNGKVIYRTPVESSAPLTARSAQDRPVTRLIHRVEPAYPSDARAQGIQGPVVLDVQVLESGDVGTVQVVSGNPLLVQAALDAVKQWRFQPYSTPGSSGGSHSRITIKFILPSA